MADARQTGEGFLDSLTVSGPGLYGDPFARYTSTMDDTARQPSVSVR